MGRRRTPLANARASGPAPSALLQALKRGGSLTIRELAQDLGITYEAVRQQIAELQRAGWVTGANAAASGARLSKPGPASRRYRLSVAAEHLFPKHYDALSAELVQQLIESFGAEGVVEILGRMTDARVRRWAPLLQSLSVKQKLKALPKVGAFYGTWYPTRWVGWGRWPRFADWGPLATHLRYLERTTLKLPEVAVRLDLRYDRSTLFVARACSIHSMRP